MSTLESKGSDPREVFHLQRIVRVHDTNSFIVVALHARTSSPIDATLSLKQMLYGLGVFYGPDKALQHLVQLNENNLIEEELGDGPPLCVSPNELVRIGFNQKDVCQIVEQSGRDCV